MRSALAWLWALPWPRSIRRLAEILLFWRPLRWLIFPQFLVGVTGIITNESGEILLLRHTYRRDTPWGLPGGFLEHREQPHDALRREINEETGFEVVLNPVHTVYADPDRPHLTIVFGGTFVSGEFQESSEISEAQFFPLVSMPDILPEQRELIRRLHISEVTH